MPTGKPTKMKACKICGELFLPEKPSSKICKKDHITECPICHKEMVWNTTRKVEPCSPQCRKELRRQLNLEKYGVEHPMQNEQVKNKHKKSMLEKYGVESPLQSKEIRQKAIETNRKKFGTDWALSSPEVKQKAEATMLEKYGGKTTLESEQLRKQVNDTMLKKYGVSNIMRAESAKQHAKATFLEKYGVSNPMQNEDIVQSAIKTRIENHESYWTQEMTEKCKQTWIATLGVDNPSKSQDVIDKIKSVCLERYGVPFGCLIDSAQAHKNRISKTNLRFLDLLQENNIQAELEYYLDGKLYDFYLPESNTLIEIDPTYTHNAVGNHWTKKGLDIQYHKEKSKLAEDNGYKCIHVYDWDNWDKIINLLLPKKSIYARKCTIYKLNSKTAEEFLRNYHLQGTCRGQLLCLGLVLDHELYQVMTFGNSRYDKKHYVELLRLCTKPGYTVIGGASRLFSYATKELGLYNIISYCDSSKFKGDVYSKIGMRLIRQSEPQEIWSKGNQKITANLLRQRGFDQLFGTDYGKGSNNEKLMLENGWLPVYDCGQRVYEF